MKFKTNKKKLSKKTPHSNIKICVSKAGEGALFVDEEVNLCSLCQRRFEEQGTLLNTKNQS